MTSSLRVPFCVNIASVLPADVELLLDCLKNGFDGAVHGGNALFSEHEEYRVFSPNQVTVLGVQRLGHMQSPRGTHRASCPG
ncbi:hypothetical protein PuT2_14060 [Pusillimonas sp. T2]|uniref:hypothetical protein n=1 Tax=Pusillimonas sp. T2 TaxID=1548123 RepID=UPI000B9C8EAC|nr:hypothetical protein [Pusillimonas sp. T2]OXR48144.1 hypothetical protein PuT2_14060 [Pusillimonas sp. T2]